MDFFRPLLCVKNWQARCWFQHYSVLLFIHRNGDGFLDREEFGEILHLTGEPVTEDDIDEMFGESDTNKDGKIDFDGKINLGDEMASSLLDVHIH